MMLWYEPLLRVASFNAVILRSDALAMRLRRGVLPETPPRSASGPQNGESVNSQISPFPARCGSHTEPIWPLRAPGSRVDFLVISEAASQSPQVFVSISLIDFLRSSPAAGQLCTATARAWGSCSEPGLRSERRIEVA